MRFEYIVNVWPDPSLMGAEHTSVKDAYEAILNDLGGQGWELVVIDNGAAIYKRKLPNPGYTAEKAPLMQRSTHAPHGHPQHLCYPGCEIERGAG